MYFATKLYLQDVFCKLTSKAPRMFPREALALHNPNIIPRLKEQYNTITVDVAKYRLGKVKFEQMLPAAVFLFCSM